MTSNESGEVPLSAQAGLTQFSNYRILNLETYRKDGSGVRTPLLFVIYEGRLHMRTPADTWKVRRIRRNPRVRLVPSDARGTPSGTWIDGTAQLQPADDVAWYNPAARRKFGLFKIAMDFRALLTRKQYVVISVTPD